MYTFIGLMFSGLRFEGLYALSHIGKNKRKALRLQVYEACLPAPLHLMDIQVRESEQKLACIEAVGHNMHTQRHMQRESKATYLVLLTSQGHQTV